MNQDVIQKNKLTAANLDFRVSKGAALITGGSRGIGYELAKLLAADGHPLILVAQNEAQLKAVSEELEERYSITIKYIACDLAQPNAAENLFEKIQYEPLQYLINDAGIGNAGEFAHTDFEADQRLLQLNIVTLTLLTKLCLPLLEKRQNARILQVASTAAFQPGPYFATYYASKAYVLSFSQALALELHHSSVKVTCLCPGPTTTEFHKRAKLEQTRLFEQHMMTAATVAKIGYQAMQSGQSVVIPGWRNKLLIALSRVAPACLTARAAGYFNQKRQR
jgi:short-subunit dehydrogenase